MSSLCRRTLFIVSFAVLMVAASAAYGQDCGTVCDPYSSACDQYCEVCWMWDYEGCIQWQGSTCGATAAGCVDPYCTPNWQEVSRVTQGTYDGRSLWGCNHHVVQSVEVEDQNECNTNSAYNSYSYCDDWIDDYKDGCCYPSCCEGIGENNTQLECNGIHSCS
ncbi:MAG TPA: hypothetical protein VEK57_03040 [Thermoanaerobaculia bacterium]|nr:hypothetical protein [Thermoanaerobaculia bacterium]